MAKNKSIISKTKKETKKPSLSTVKGKAIVKKGKKEEVVFQQTKPDAKHKLVLEYIINASPKLIYEFLTSPSGLSEWFADDVNIQGNVYSFIWDGAKQQANVVAFKEDKFIRFHWCDRPADTYFEYKIEKNELTDEISLLITDFAETEEEKDDLENLWQGQVQRLKKVLGSKA